MAGGWWLWRERRARRARESHPEQQPEFVEDLLYACFRAGHPNVAIGVVTGGGLPYMKYHKGLLLASPQVADGLTAAELSAVVRHTLAASTDTGPSAGLRGERMVRRQFQRYLEQAGDPVLYISAVIKRYRADLDAIAPPRQRTRRSLTHRAQRHIHLLAAMTGLGPDEVAALVQEAGAPLELADPLA
jgi:hypothetical protein